MSIWQDYNPNKKRGRYLIKFLSEKHLDHFLNSGEIWFSRADDFGDKMECVTINDLLKEEFPFEELINRKRRHLISCWHNVGRESISMWDTSYPSPDKRRVYALKFEAEELINQIHSSDFKFNTKEKLFGSVIYKSLLRDKHALQEDRVRRAAFRKEYSYNYEQEFRFVIKGKSTFENKGYGLYIGNPEDLNYQIMVNPLLKKDKYNQLTGKLNLSEIGKRKYKESELVHWLKPLEW
jgi:hypothetical protein